MRESLRILYVGDLQEGGTCLQRMKALQYLGHKVVEINTRPQEARKRESSLLYRLYRKMYRLGINAFKPKDFAGANNSIIENMRLSSNWDVLWLDKGLTIEKRTLEYVKDMQPKCLIVGYSPDDMYARHNQSPQFLEHLSLYDIFFTTKSYNVNELNLLGCNRVVFVNNAFDPNTHKPMILSEEERRHYGGSVGFIGSYERDRAKSMYKLAKNGIKIRIWGQGWQRSLYRNSNLILEKRPIWGSEYAKAICSFDINLCFLRKINRDLQSTRSIEIPACGAFMLAERTNEHLMLFEEGKEAEYFSSDEELIDKVKYYLNHPEERIRIAVAGRERCLKSRYSYYDRMKEMIKIITGEKTDNK